MVNDNTRKYERNAELLPSAEPFYTEGMGWAIRTRYNATASSTIDIEYRPAGKGDWLPYEKNRKASYGKVDIHGQQAMGDDSKNLRGGLYEVRLRVKENQQYGPWTGTLVAVPFYFQPRNWMPL